MREISNGLASIGLLNSIFSKHWLNREAVALWTDGATLQAWLDVEVALAQAQAQLGLIPKPAAAAIAACARAEHLDVERMQQDVAHCMHPFVPVLHQLEELCGDEAAGYLHWGVTTQNIFDTGAALQLKRSHSLLVGFLDAGLLAIGQLAQTHRGTPQAGRTHGQHALPITFGFKVAGWHAELRRQSRRIREASQGAFCASMGGAVGTFSAMQGKGRSTQDLVAKILELESADIPVRTAFDAQASYLSALAQMGTTIEKIANEIVFMQRTEIAEVGEAFHFGKIGSSTMAQKRNPQHALNLVGLSRLLRSRVPVALECMLRGNEGDSASSNVGDMIVPEVVILAVSLLDGLGTLIRGLGVNAQAMAKNLEMTQGLILSEAVMMRLAQQVGRHKAHKILYEVAQASTETGDSLGEGLRKHADLQALLPTLNLPDLLDAKNYLGEASACVDDELARPLV